MRAITINELAKAVKAEQEKGNGTKMIVISDDDEGNGFHELYFGFSPLTDFAGSGVFLHFDVEKNMENYVTLG